jgi:hypothetical protein
VHGRYGPVVRWWNERVREFRPGSPFEVRDAASLREAKQLLEENKDKVSEALWSKGNSPYHLARCDAPQFAGSWKDKEIFFTAVRLVTE